MKRRSLRRPRRVVWPECVVIEPARIELLSAAKIGRLRAEKVGPLRPAPLCESK